jgi:hypothetical protein
MLPAATMATRLFVTFTALNVMQCWTWWLAQFLLLSQTKHFTNDPETETENENESLEVGRLSVEFIQRRFNP